MNPTEPSTPPQSVVELLASDVLDNGSAFCPNPKMGLWNQHPRVFLDIATTGQARCPYCGTAYRLKAGEVLHGGH